MNTRLITGPLSTFTADPDRIHTALDRQSILRACAQVVVGLGSAIATVDDKVNPPASIAGRRNRAERRWAVASVDLDDAARTAGTLGFHLFDAAGQAGDLITEGEPVQYAGGLTEYHGRYVLLSDCSCDPDCVGFEIYRGPRGTALQCVNGSSLYPEQGNGVGWGASDAAYRVGRLLDTEPRKLPDILDAEQAVTIVRGLNHITGRVIPVLAGWHDAFAKRLDRRCLLHLNTFDYGGVARRRLLADLDRITPDLSAVRRHLRNAMSTLAEIEATARPGRQVA
ncbi:hypothetical protein [Winogradskya consettensis]|nr:hypothetical protein [Actinoplanes consettensis]